MFEVTNTKNAPAAIGPYSQAIAMGNLLFTSGQIPLDPQTGEVAGTTIAEQAEQVMKNLGAVLAANGIGYENTIKNTFKNAVLLSVAKLPYTVLMLIITAGPVIITFLNTRNLLIGIAVWLIIGVSLVAWLNSFLLRKVFEIFHTNEN